MIFYNDEKHIYYNQDREIYDSPSKILRKYKQPFNTKEVAESYAKKHGETPEYWISKWKNKNETAIDRGHNIHNTKEVESNEAGIEKIGGAVRRVQNADLITITDLLQLPDGVYNEFNIWNHGRKIAGRPDKIVLETINSKRYASIYDFKTNGSIDKISYQYKNGNYKMLLGPVSHIMDSNWNHYSIQLSIYQWILEAAGFIPANRELIHIQHPVEFIVGTIQPPDTPYPVPYMKSEVLNILEDYNKNRIPQHYYGN
jgi:hypothetical protein